MHGRQSELTDGPKGDLILALGSGGGWVCGITFAGSCTQTVCYAMSEFASAFFSKYDHELFQFQEHFTFGSYKRTQFGVISETSPCF